MESQAQQLGSLITIVGYAITGLIGALATMVACGVWVIKRMFDDAREQRAQQKLEHDANMAASTLMAENMTRLGALQDQSAEQSKREHAALMSAIQDLREAK